MQYLALRTVLLVVVAAVLYLIGLRGIWWIASAFLISGLISLFALSGQRDVAAGSLESAFSRLNRRINRAAAAEDELLDEERNIPSGPAYPAPAHPSRAESAPAHSAPAEPATAGPAAANQAVTNSSAPAASIPESGSVSDSGVGVQAAGHEIDTEEVDQEGRKGQ